MFGVDSQDSVGDGQVDFLLRIDVRQRGADHQRPVALVLLDRHTLERDPLLRRHEVRYGPQTQPVLEELIEEPDLRCRHGRGRR